MTSACYVYAITVGGVIRYVGRGRGKRLLDHKYNMNRYLSDGTVQKQIGLYSRLAEATVSGESVLYTKIVDGLSPEEATAREIAEIRRYPADQLWNAIFPRRPKLNNEVLRERISAALKEKWGTPSFRDKMVEIRARPDVRERMSAAAQKRSANPEWKKKNAHARQKADACDPERHREATKQGMSDAGLRSYLSNKAKARATVDRVGLLARLTKARERLSESRKHPCQDCRQHHRKCEHTDAGIVR